MSENTSFQSKKRQTSFEPVLMEGQKPFSGYIGLKCSKCKVGTLEVLASEYRTIGFRFVCPQCGKSWTRKA